jgi:hypothetical protein
MKRVQRILIKCDFCEKEFEKYEKDLKPTNYCSSDCHHKSKKGKSVSNETKQKISLKCSGKNNGMFGKHHSIETCKDISDKAKNHYEENPELRYICGNSRLNKDEKKRIGKLWGANRTKESREGHFHSDESKKIIGKKSSAKFTSEYKKRVRKKLEENGKLIPMDMMDDYLLYKQFSNWKERMIDLIDDEKQLILLSEHGIFNCKTNKKGTVRDHMFSRYSGWKNGVFPELIRHPCNCEILLHGDNLRKKKGWHGDTDSQTFEELVGKIQNFNKKWKEQSVCIELIKKYNQGLRYNKQTYIENYYERY